MDKKPTTSSATTASRYLLASEYPDCVFCMGVDVLDGELNHNHKVVEAHGFHWKHHLNTCDRIPTARKLGVQVIPNSITGRLQIGHLCHLLAAPCSELLNRIFAGAAIRQGYFLRAGTQLFSGRQKMSVQCAAKFQHPGIGYQYSNSSTNCSTRFRSQ